MSESDMSESDKGEKQTDLAEAVKAFRTEFRKVVRPLERASKALDALAEAGGTARLDAVTRAVDALDGLKLDGAETGGSPGGEAFPGSKLATDHEALVRRLGVVLTRLAAETRSSLLRDLNARAAEDGLEPVLVSERPLSVLLAPTVVELDLVAGRAVVTYAREPVLETEATAAKILAARTRAIDSIRELSVGSEAFFGKLEAAYRMVLAARGRADGERVDLVDLLAPLSVLQHDPDGWRRDAPDKIAAYPRFLLAYQLNRLRRDGLLARGGRRVELGTATGGSTRNKRDVLYVPTSPTEGQYHLSIRFTAA